MNMSFRGATLSLSLPLTFFSTNGWAQDSTEGVTLEEVKVEARRVSERLQDVPLAVSAFTQAQLEEQSVDKVQDLQRITPSLTVSASTRGYSTPAYSIRGQRAFDASILTDPAIAVYFAEVGQTRMTGSNATLFDLESVEVLKGPQGTLFGRNTTGGAILVRPKAPGKELGGYLRVRAGDESLREGEGVINLPLSETLALRVGAKATQRDGYMHNIVNGQNGMDVNEVSSRVGLAWNPSDALSSVFYATYYSSDTVGSVVKIDQFNIAGLPAPFRAFFGPRIAGDLAENASIGDYDYRGSLDRSARDEVWSAQNTTELSLSDNLVLRNIVGYKDIHSTYQIEHMETQALNTTGGLVDMDQLSEELQLVADIGDVSLIGGLFYFTEDGTDYRVSESWAELPGPNAFPFTLNDFDAENSSYSAYLHADVPLAAISDGLSLTAGARWTRDKREVDYFIRNERGGPSGHGGPIGPYVYQCVLTGATSSVNTRDFCRTSAEHEFEEPTYDISLNYAINPEALVYLAHRHGYRSGGFILSPTVAPTDLEPYRPETVDDLELGAKTEFHLGDAPVRLNTALFYSEGEDVQRQVNVIAQNRIANRIVNAAETTVWGAEVELSMRFTERWRADFSFSHIDASYDKWTDTYNVAGVPTVVDISDSKFVMVPENQFGISSRYTLPLSDTVGEVSLFASYYHQSEVETTENNTANCGPNGLYAGCLNANTSQPGYGLVNARIDWDNVLNKGFDVGLFVNNVTDELYETWGYTLNNATGWRTSFIGAPRMWGIEVRMAFGGDR